MTGVTLGELAEAVGGTLHGPAETLITGAASIAEAGTGDIVLAENYRYLEQAAMCPAAAVIAGGAACGDKPVIRVADPRRAFAEVLQRLMPGVKAPSPGIDASCHVGERVKCAESAAVGYGCWIGDDVAIGEGTVVHPLVYIEDRVRIGADCVIHPHVAIHRECDLGSRVTVHSGAVIGSDGFGYIQVGDELRKVPQIGAVVIEDDVEIGANAAIDRAKTGATRIGRGTKIDNLVQIAHNVKIGRSCVIVSQAGLSGSVEIGDGVTIAGQAGINGHVHVGDGAVVGGQSAVLGDLAPGGTYSGYPARPHREALRAQAALLRVPDALKAIKRLECEVDRLRRRLEQLGGEEVGAESE